jgi:hypothetical protein
MSADSNTDVKICSQNFRNQYFVQQYWQCVLQLWIFFSRCSNHVYCCRCTDCIVYWLTAPAVLYCHFALLWCSLFVFVLFWTHTVSPPLTLIGYNANLHIMLAVMRHQRQVWRYEVGWRTRLVLMWPSFYYAVF